MDTAGSLVDHPRREARWSVRMRLTLLYGGLTFLTGAVVIGCLLLAVDHVIRSQAIEFPSKYLEVLVDQADDTGSVSPEAIKSGAASAAEAVRQQLRRQTLEPLIVPSAVLLTLMGLMSFAVGWTVSGRVLRPITRITDVARTVSSTQLGGRVAMPGPTDEIVGLADTVDAMLERLDRAFDQQRRFIANAAHELRTPVAVARTLAEVAQTDPDADEAVRRLAASLVEVTRRQEDAIGALLILAKAQRGLTASDLSEIDLSRGVASALDLIESERASNAVRVSLTLCGATVRGSAPLIQSLVDNLVANAVRHNVPGGEVEISTGVDERGRARLTVRNSGEEIDEVDLDQLLQPFQRGVGRVATAKGSGLGLSIVEDVARIHDAVFSIRPGAGGGLEVTVTFQKARTAIPV